MTNRICYAQFLLQMNIIQSKAINVYNKQTKWHTIPDNVLAVGDFNFFCDLCCLEFTESNEASIS